MCFSWIWSCWDVSDKPKCERDYDAARRELSWDISWADAIDQKPMETWVEPYLQEETLGIANLQRQYRLLKRYGEERQKPLYQEGVQKREDVQYKPSDEARCLYDTVRGLYEELQTLRVEYWSHRDRLFNLEVDRPCKILAKQIMIRRQHRDRYNRPFSWTVIREGCVARGGYCSRGCGCCEKELDAYIFSRNKCQEWAAVYGHCTGECACCIEAHGRYVQNAGLPPTEF